MKRLSVSVFSKITLLFSIIFTAISILFTLITYYATVHFYEASTQLLNKDVAAHIAKFNSPFRKNGVNRNAADSILKNAMIVNPSAEVYFLDTVGNIIYYHAPFQSMAKWKVPLADIKMEILHKGTIFLKGLDPKDPAHPKIFSASEVNNGEIRLGYIYVILGSREFRSVNEMFWNSHAIPAILRSFFIVAVLSLLIALAYLNRSNRQFGRIINTLKKFQEGDRGARLEKSKKDEFLPITHAFNDMADLIVKNMNQIEKTEDLRKRLIANLSHDLRTPLSLIKGYAETLLIEHEVSTTDTHDQEYYQIILVNIAKLEKMVSQLFELSKMESVTFEPQKEPFVFSELLFDVVKAAQIVAKERNISLDCVHCDEKSWVFGDIGMLERLVQNLMDNALKYTPAGGVITISLGKMNGFLRFLIQNSGEPFSTFTIGLMRSDEEAIVPGPSEKNGSGLGLRIVRKILGLHQFSFEINSDQNGRNNFSFTMPEYTMV